MRSPFSFPAGAVFTRFLRREMQKQQTRNKKGLSSINFSTIPSFTAVDFFIDKDCGDARGNGFFNEIVFALLLKHDDGIMYILLLFFLSLLITLTIFSTHNKMWLNFGSVSFVITNWPIFFPLNIYRHMFRRCVQCMTWLRTE